MWTDWIDKEEIDSWKNEQMDGQIKTWKQNKYEWIDWNGYRHVIWTDRKWWNRWTRTDVKWIDKCDTSAVKWVDRHDTGHEIGGQMWYRWSKMVDGLGERWYRWMNLIWVNRQINYEDETIEKLLKWDCDKLLRWDHDKLLEWDYW